jgi:hypothetical protein
MSPNVKDQVTRLLAILASGVVAVGVNVPCVWVGSLAINPGKDPVSSLSKADALFAVAILALTGTVCGATFAKSRRALWLWLTALLLAAAVSLAWWHLNSQLSEALAKLRSHRPESLGFEMLWGWFVLAAGGALQLGTALWATLCPVRATASPGESAALPQQPPEVSPDEPPSEAGSP